jgi:hypothetical protein
MKLVRYTGSEDWSALYVDGDLDRVGDHYLIDERIQELYKVEDIRSDDFMRGGNYSHDVAQTLAEVDEWVAEAERVAVLAEQARARAGVQSTQELAEVEELTAAEEALEAAQQRVNALKGTS